jgi:hypothetical protein
MVASTFGNTSFDELTYKKRNEVWLVVTGCSASCFDSNRTTITQIMSFVRVGSVA